MGDKMRLDRVGVATIVRRREEESDADGRMGRRRFLRRGVVAALALLALGVAVGASPGAGSSQTAVVVILTEVDPETGVGGWIDTADGGRYDASTGW